MKGNKNMHTIVLKDEFIKLGQALKSAGMASTGIEAKLAILDYQVKVNGEVETRRGRKLVAGDMIEFKGEQIKIEG